jgi:hypothetical protein
VVPNNIWSFDELILPHEGKHDPLVAFIPRKPHPLGIISYLGAAKLSRSGLPFVMDILPVTSDNGLSGPHAFQEFIFHLPGKSFSFFLFIQVGILGQLPVHDTHIVVDALFPTATSLDFAEAAGIKLTWSQNAAHKANLMSVMSEGLTYKRWRMVCVPQKQGFDQLYFVYSDSKLIMGGMALLLSLLTPRFNSFSAC